MLDVRTHCKGKGICVLRQPLRDHPGDCAIYELCCNRATFSLLSSSIFSTLSVNDFLTVILLRIAVLQVTYEVFFALCDRDFASNRDPTSDL